MHKRILRILLTSCLFAVVCSAQDPLEGVFGASHSNTNAVIQFHADNSFFLILDTLEYHGTYSLSPNGMTMLKADDGSVLECVLRNDSLLLPTKRLTRCDRTTTIASFLASERAFGTLKGATRQAIVMSFVGLAHLANEYRERTGSFQGFLVPDDLARSAYATITADVSPDQVTFQGVASRLDGAVHVTLKAAGKLSNWTYFKSLM